MQRILGIDPGSRITGYGIIEQQAGKQVHVASGCIRLTDAPLPVRLHQLFEELGEVIALHQPSEMAVEEVFVSRNPSSALKLGQARGAAICAGARNSLKVSEYSAREIKQALVGKGSAHKSQVQHMVSLLLRLEKPPQADAADALAVALCHAHTHETVTRWRQRGVPDEIPLR